LAELGIENDLDLQVAKNKQASSSPSQRDPAKIDPSTNNPFCFGFQSPEVLICMMCSFEQTCREQKKANKAKGGNAALGFFEVEEDPFDDNDDELEDDDFLDE
jgi:hypothetical protein